MEEYFFKNMKGEKNCLSLGDKVELYREFYRETTWRHLTVLTENVVEKTNSYFFMEGLMNF